MSLFELPEYFVSFFPGLVLLWLVSLYQARPGFHRVCVPHNAWEKQQALKAWLLGVWKYTGHPFPPLVSLVLLGRPELRISSL